MKKANKVYGIVGLRSIMSNFNADFTGNPKKFLDTYYASDVALKYAYRSNWVGQGEKVYVFKSFKENKKKLVPKNIEERYEELFGKKLSKDLPSKEVLTNLFSCIDIESFGTAFAVKGHNYSVQGAVQFTKGLNLYEETRTIRDDLLSPYQNSSDGDANQSTLGNKAYTDEAHYFYGFSINPNNYLPFEESIGCEGYSEEAYQKFKETTFHAGSSLNSASKSGCQTEFALFVELKENSKLSLPNLHKYIQFVKTEEGENRIVLDDLYNRLAKISDQVESIEVYYDSSDTEITSTTIELPVKRYDILGQKEITE